MRTMTLTSLGMSGDNVIATVLVEDNGVDVTPPDLNPITVVNPPILVPDPNGDVTRTALIPDPNGDIVLTENGSTTTYREEVSTYREDPRAALLETLASAVR